MNKFPSPEFHQLTEVFPLHSPNGLKIHISLEIVRDDNN